MQFLVGHLTMLKPVSGYGHNSDKYAGWNETTNADHWITSPMVKDSIDLNFWLAAYNDAANLQVKVQVSSNGIDWTDEATFASKGAGGDFGLDYVEKTVPIAKIGNYYIRWTTANYVEGGFYIDDVTVTPYTEPVNVGSDPMTVNKFELAQNYPNPFNPTTRINYSVPSDSKVTISIYSITGELVAELVNDNLSAGTYSVNFNGSNLASGMYIYRMVAGSFVQTHKMMLLK